MASRSRIPRSTSTNENAPATSAPKPSLAGKLAAPVKAAAARTRIPSASSLLSNASSTGPARPASRLNKSASSSTLHIRNLAPVAAEEDVSPAYGSLVGIAVQVPTSDPDREASPLEVEDAQKKVYDEEATGEAEQMPTPPNSQSPPRTRMAEEASTSRLPRSRSTTSQLAPPSLPTSKRRSSRSPSVAAIPAGPSHAPHVLAAHRRSSVSPYPPSQTSSSSKKPSVSPAPAPAPAPVPPASRASTLPKHKTKQRGLRARPSETLPEPIVLSSDEEDELLLLGPEQTRGKGEGKAGARRHGRGGTPVVASASLGRSMRARAQAVEQVKDEEMSQEADELLARVEEAAQPAEEQQSTGGDAHLEPFPALEDDADLGGFDGDDAPYDDDLAGSFGAHEQHQPEAEAEVDYSLYGQTDGFIALQDPSSGSEADPDEFEEQPAAAEVDADVEAALPPQVKEEPARASSPAAAEDASSDDASDLDLDLASASTSFVFRRTRPSYPPLSPNQTGEYDSIVEVRLDSSPPRSRAGSVQLLDVEVQAEVEAVQELEEVEEQVQEEQLALPVPPSTGYRSPSPAVLSPFFRRASATPAQAPSSVPRRSTPALTFASPRLPRERYPHLALNLPPSPVGAPISAAPAPLASASASKTWTRGPAFFRSSSFSPPPHADQPRTATLYARHPGAAVALSSPGVGEQSKEYHRFADLTPTSPHVEEIRELREEVRGMSEELGPSSAHSAEDEQEDEEDEEEEEEEEDGLVLVGQEQTALDRARSASASPPRSDNAAPAAQPDADHLPPPTPAKDRDIHMSSPSPIASRHFSTHGSSPSPPRSPNGDILMSSPPASLRHAAGAASPAASIRSFSADKRLPATPSAAGAHEADEDARMGSPSPAKPLQTGGRERTTSLGERVKGLLFGPRAVASVEQPAAEVHAVHQGDEDEEDEDEQDEDDQPFTAPHLHPRAPASVAAESTFSTSHLSIASSTSRRSNSSRSKRRPSHPSLPVIEISSTDAKAAARAAAILKCYHDYIEQGIESAEDGQGEKEKSLRGAEEEEEEEEELRTLLLDAEDEVRQQLPPRRPADADASTSAASPAVAASRPAAPAPAPATPASSRSAHDSRSRPRASSSQGLSSVVNTAVWTPSDWRRLEQVLVELGRRQRRGESVSTALSLADSLVSGVSAVSAVGEEVDPERVVEAFLRKWGVERDECEGQWSWDTLVTRVNALKTRRAKDVRLKRAESLASNLLTTTSPYGKAPLPPTRTQDRRAPPETLEQELRRASSPAAPESDEERSGDEERSASPAVEVKQEQNNDDEGDSEEQRSGDITSSDDEDDETRQLADDTFFAVSRSRKARRVRRTSVQPVYLPTALANPALRHLYEATPPEKPKVPVRDYLNDEPASSEHDASGEQEVSRDPATPEPETAAPAEAPSSASRLISYLGSFVRRSPAPSPASARHGSPTPSLSPSPEEPEMRETRLHAGLVTPHFTTTDKPFPLVPGANKPLPHLSDRKILPLPPSHLPQSSTPASQPIASTSRVTLDESATTSSRSTTRPRRRSSGEANRVREAIQAIEEAESSREEEEARIIELLQSARGAKRRAVPGDLREREEGAPSAKWKGKGRAVDSTPGLDPDASGGSWRGFVEIDRELGRGMVPSGTRALDRRPSGEMRASRR
ncbi:hypothetical protein JCM10207_005911 [Rhodosporidiobolus poonsookiae]